LNSVVGRHASLRTTCEVDARGTRVPVIPPRRLEPFPVVDHRDRADPAAFAYAEAAREARAPFDLRHGPLLRTRLLRIAADDHLLLVTIHHIVSDGWSTDVLLREVMALYDAFVHGRPSPLRPLAFQYADFASSQRAWLQCG